MQDVLEPRLRLKARLEPSTQPLPNLKEEVENTILTALVVRGSAPIQGSSSSGTDVLVDSSAAMSMSVEDMVQTSVPDPSNVGIQPSSSGIVGSLSFNESKARDFETLTDLVLTSKTFPGKAQQGIGAVDLTDVCSPALFNERSMQPGPSTGVAAHLQTGWILATKSRRDKRDAKRKTGGLDGKSTVPIFLDLAESRWWQLNSTGGRIG